MKRYRDLNGYLREQFGERVQKIPLDAGLGCPNRDGTLSRRGCIFCDALGSGTGAWVREGVSIGDQIRKGKAFLRRRYGARRFIAYFQSFSNTYAPVERLRELWSEALSDRDVVGLSVATRPDCVDRERLEALAGYQEERLVWIELGLQSCHPRTLARINRGHGIEAFEDAVILAEQFSLPVVVHCILGLPGEDLTAMRETARYLAGLPIMGVKLHMLYVVEGTALAEDFARGAYVPLSREVYVRGVVAFLEELPPTAVIHRLTGDPPSVGCLAPGWAADKRETLGAIEDALERSDTRQGRAFSGSRP